MSDLEIKKAVQLARTAISKRVNGRAQYSPHLRATLLSAADAVGFTRFSKLSGVTQSLLFKWKQKSIREEHLAAVKPAHVSSPVRELMVTPVPIFSESELNTSQSSQRAILHAGHKLKIEVPLDWLTPDRISDILGCLQEKQVKHG